MTSKTSLWLALALGITLGGMSTVHAADTAIASDDPYLWLEATHGARAMDWVKQQNAITEKAFASSAEFERARSEILQVLDSARRRITLVSYAVYRIPNVCEALVRAARRGVRIAVILETPNRLEGQNEYDTLRAMGDEVAACSSV